MGEMDALGAAAPDVASTPADPVTADPGAIAAAVATARPELLDAIGVTAEQKARIDDIVRKASLDLEAIGARHAQRLRVSAAASNRWMRAMVDAANVLTPEQRDALAQRIRARQADQSG